MKFSTKDIIVISSQAHFFASVCIMVCYTVTSQTWGSCTTKFQSNLSPTGGLEGSSCVQYFVGKMCFFCVIPSHNVCYKNIYV